MYTYVISMLFTSRLEQMNYKVLNLYVLTCSIQTEVEVQRSDRRPKSTHSML